MNADRIKEIQETTAYPDSISVYRALLQVWNECEQEQAVKNNAVLPHVNNCPAWLDVDDFEYAKELYKESKIDAVKYLMKFARLHVTKPLKTCKELLDGCC
jgi:hypothetical protein